MEPITRHNLYEIDVGDTYRSRFAYASGYTPLPDRKSFVPPAMQERNRQFTEINGFKPGIRIWPQGPNWPDFLFNGGGYVSFFVSHRVIADIKSADIEFLDATEFPIEAIEGGRKKLRIEDAPRYFVLEAQQELVPDWEAMKIPQMPGGRPILDPLPKPWPPSPFIYRKDTWSGRDLFSSERCTVQLFCSERFKNYAESRKWTNVTFQRIGAHILRSSAEADRK
jgi:hypothetical protein